jgi:hypothetical protein
VVNGSEPMLRLIGAHAGGVRSRLRVGWLVELLEDYGFDPHLVSCEIRVIPDVSVT